MLPKTQWIIPAAAFAVLISVIAVVAAAIQTAPATYRLAYVDRAGNTETIGSITNRVFAVRVSPSGKQLAFDISGGPEAGIWIYELAGDHSKRKLPTSGNNNYPMWSGDGSRILYNSDREGEPAIFWQAADGTGAAERLTPPARAPESWSAQNQMFSFITANGADYDVWTYSFRDKRAAPLFALAGSAQHSSAFSPDGRWIAYMSDQEGKQDVWVQDYPMLREKHRISLDGGTHPIWSPDGKEMFYDSNGRFFSVSIQTQPQFTSGTPIQLPISGFVQGLARRQYDITPDGKRFVMLFRSAS